MIQRHQLPALALAPAHAPLASAQDAGLAKPVRWVVRFAAGGTSGALASTVGNKAQPMREMISP